jgi:Uma2 family endonuclease
MVYATPDDPHMAAVMPVIYLFGEAQRAGYGRAGVDRNVALAEGTVVRPDAFFVVADRVAILSAGRAVQGGPDIVLEVLNPSTRQHDLPGAEKFRAYALAGVRFYWLVDTAAHTVAIYELRESGFIRTALLAVGDTLRCPLFPELALQVKELFITTGDPPA